MALVVLSRLQSSLEPISTGSLALQTASLAAPTTKSPHIRLCTLIEGAPCRQMRAVLRAARGPSRRAASNINNPRPGRRAAWHKGRPTSRHEHRGIERGDAPASAMHGVALRCADFVTARCTLTRRLSQAGRSFPVRLPVPSLLQRDRPAGLLQRHT